MPNDTVIAVENLGKRYTIGHERPKDSLRDQIAHTVGRWLRRDNAASPAHEDFWALTGVSFGIARGEVVGIVGRNGAGKSTLLKILSRITEPTTGRARIRGRVASLLEVGTGFHPELTGRENIFLNGAILGMTRIEIARKFDEIVAFAEVEKFIDTPVKHYSSGMYVRLAFAVAAHLDPEILIVDEVLAVGDAAFQKKCLGKMQSAAAGGGRTVLFVSHNMGAVRTLCQNCVWLQQGRLREHGPTAAVVDHYLRESGAGAGLDFDVSALPRTPGYGDRLRITRAIFNGGQPIHHGAPLAVEVRFTVSSAIEDVALGVGFSNPEGTRMFTVESDLPGARLAFAKRGDYLLRGHVDQLHLQPGLYQIDVGARSGEFNALDYLAGCAQVEVLPGPDTRGTLIRGGVHVRYPSTWK